MASASVSPRRRPRSPRLLRAVILIGVATLVAVGAVVVSAADLMRGTWPVAAGLVVLALGALATRVTHQEVLVARRDEARGRAGLAKDYRTLADARAQEHTEYAAAMGRRLEEAEQVHAEQLATIRAHEAALDRRERRLAAVEAELETAKDRLAGTEALARSQSLRADDLAARLAELESERDALRSELQLWQSAASSGASQSGASQSGAHRRQA